MIDVRSHLRLMEYATFLSVFVGSAGCGGPPAEQPVSEALGESSCATAPPDAEWDQEIPPPPGCQRIHVFGDKYATICPHSESGNSPEHYSNPQCYKANVVKITNWRYPDGDLTVRPATDYLESLDYNQSQCESLWMAVTVYQNTAREPFSPNPPMTRHARGQWVSEGGAIVGQPHCILPAVTFGGASWRTDRSDVDYFVPFQDYTITASYRTSSSSAAQTLKIHWSTARPRCGQPGQACCTNETEITGPTNHCDGNAVSQTCTDGRCVECGKEGQPPCMAWPYDYSNPTYECSGSRFLQITDGDSGPVCTPCGLEGQSCCHNGMIIGGCSDGNTICRTQTGTNITPTNPTLCLQPLPPDMTPPPDPSQSPAPNCGLGSGYMCCPENSAYECKVPWQCNHQTWMCQPPQNNCVVWVNVFPVTCYDYQGIPSSIIPQGSSVQTCGATYQDAVNNAKLSYLNSSLGLALCEDAGPNCCTYAVTQ